MGIYKLQNQIQHYDWGSFDVIPNLLEIKNTAGKPFAELWIGAHLLASSQIITSLGAKSLRAHLDNTDGLPYLLKILSARMPLSIQLHPNAEQAAKGYAKEEQAGIALRDPERMYKDRNHKPELLVALETTFALCSFRKYTAIHDDFTHLDFAAELPLPAVKETSSKQAETIAQLFGAVLQLDGRKKIKCIESIRKYADAKQTGIYDRYWWLAELLTQFPADLGCLAPLFLNLVHLNPGDAVFLSPCEIHAYLRGSGLEIMAASDNVLRAGCTGKYINKEELLRIASFTPVDPCIIAPSSASAFEKVYRCPVKEFELSFIDLQEDRPLQAERKILPEIILCMQGWAVLGCDGQQEEIALRKGQSAYIDTWTPRLTMRGSGRLYRASLPGAAGVLQQRS